jgi:predicted house-cleaning NTP pyrophosphatase (Maf/HAM1 superfamily)
MSDAAEPEKPQRRPRTLAERLAAAKAEALAKKLAVQKLEGLEKKQRRKLDTREKIVIGGTVLARMRTNPQFKNTIVELLKDGVKKPFDREAVAQWLKPDSAD